MPDGAPDEACGITAANGVPPVTTRLTSVTLRLGYR